MLSFRNYSINILSSINSISSDSSPDYLIDTNGTMEEII